MMLVPVPAVIVFVTVVMIAAVMVMATMIVTAAMMAAMTFAAAMMAVLSAAMMLSATTTMPAMLAATTAMLSAAVMPAFVMFSLHLNDEIRNGLGRRHKWCRLRRDERVRGEDRRRDHEGYRFHFLFH